MVVLELSEIAKILKAEEDEQEWIELADSLQEKLLEHLWDGEQFFALQLPAKKNALSNLCN